MRWFGHVQFIRKLEEIGTIFIPFCIDVIIEGTSHLIVPHFQSISIYNGLPLILQPKFNNYLKMQVFLEERTKYGNVRYTLDEVTQLWKYPIRVIEVQPLTNGMTCYVRGVTSYNCNGSARKNLMSSFLTQTSTI